MEPRINKKAQHNWLGLFIMAGRTGVGACVLFLTYRPSLSLLPENILVLRSATRCLGCCRRSFSSRLSGTGSASPFDPRQTYPSRPKAAQLEGYGSNDVGAYCNTPLRKPELLKRPALISAGLFINWRGGRGSNPRPSDRQSDALTN